MISIFADHINTVLAKRCHFRTSPVPRPGHRALTQKTQRDVFTFLKKFQKSQILKTRRLISSLNKSNLWLNHCRFSKYIFLQKRSSWSWWHTLGRGMDSIIICKRRKWCVLENIQTINLKLKQTFEVPYSAYKSKGCVQNRTLYRIAKTL